MPKKESLTKTRILNSAQDLMLTKGYVATTLDEICDSAGLTKGCFFHYFPNKERLGLEVLDFYSDRIMAKFATQVLNKTNDPFEKVLGYIDLVIAISKDPASQSSCIIGNLAQEMTYLSEKIRVRCSGIIGGMSDMINGFLEKAKAKVSPNNEINTKILTETLFSLIQGSLVIAKVTKDLNFVDRNLNYYKEHLKQLYEKK